MSKPVVFIPNRIPIDVVHFLETHCDVDYRDVEEMLSEEDFYAGLARADGLMIYLRQKINHAVLEHAPLLKVISNISVGYDNLDMAELAKREILATNTPDVLTETTADLTFALLMAAARRITEADHLVKSGQWTGWMPSLMLGKDVYGATVGIVGMGRIGEAVVRRAKGFGMNVLYYNRTRKPEVEEMMGVTYEAWDDLFQKSDYVVILVPLTPESVKIVGERELRMMKQDAILINASRGAVVDELALIRALQERTIAGAGLDVFDKEPIDKNHPFVSMANVVTLPHIGSATRETRMKMAMKAAKNMVAGLHGEVPENLIPLG